jgi:hypothetical protein
LLITYLSVYMCTLKIIKKFQTIYSFIVIDITWFDCIFLLLFFIKFLKCCECVLLPHSSKFITTIVVSLNPVQVSVLDTTLYDKVYQWLMTGLWFSPGTSVSSTNKTDYHDIIEILLKVALNTKNQPSKFISSVPRYIISYRFYLIYPSWFY